jgi:D-arabinose 1-dehydrogenase-like Zn-dependent alcohol dehydrogenase
MTKMKANIFEGVNRIAIKLKEVPKPGYNEALVRVTLTTICDRSSHIEG